MKLTYGEVPYPPGAGRLLTQNCVLLVDGPCTKHPHEGMYVASAWSGHVLLAWTVGHTAWAARTCLLNHLREHFDIKDQGEWPLTML